MTTDTARKYMLATLREGRVTILHARTDPKRLNKPHEVIARVKGHRGDFRVTLRNSTWTCTCKEVGCNHIDPVRQITGHHEEALEESAPQTVTVSSTVGGEHTLEFARLAEWIYAAEKPVEFDNIKVAAESARDNKRIAPTELVTLERLWLAEREQRGLSNLYTPVWNRPERDVLVADIGLATPPGWDPSRIAAEFESGAGIPISESTDEQLRGFLNYLRSLNTRPKNYGMEAVERIAAEQGHAGHAGHAEGEFVKSCPACRVDSMAAAGGAR